MELDYWCVSLISALEDAVAQLNPDKPLTYSSMDPVTHYALELYDTALPTSLEGKLQLVETAKPEAELLVINLGYQEMYGSPVPEEYELVTEIVSYGNALMRVYSRNMP